jgi:uncharacterized membrane protein YvlD (DUF360 family)
MLLVGLKPTLPLFGFIALLFNGLMFWLGDRFVPGFAVNGFWSPVLGVTGMALVNVSFNDLLAIDDDDAFYEHLVAEIARVLGKR